MAKVKIQGNASGTGTLTLTAPNTNSDRTITLPDGTGELLAKDSSGNLGIGTSSASSKLTIKASSDSISGGLRLESADGSKYSTIDMNNSGNLRFYTSGVHRMRIDSDGNVGIGTSSPTHDLTVGNSAASDFVIALRAGVGGFLGWDDSANSTILQAPNTRSLSFRVNSDTFGAGTEAMTIGSDGITNFNQFSASGATAGVVTNSNGSTETNWKSSCKTTGFADHYSFYNPNGRVGYIRTNGTSTAYTTSSDYRLKENVTPMTGSIDRLKALNPSRFNFIADADRTVDGFLAHEAGEVVPEAITGTKDAMRTEEYEVTPAVMDGETIVTEAVMGTREVPDYQGIDQSKLVPLLVASLQEAIARIEQLENI
jgi:hypothetical protein